MNTNSYYCHCHHHRFHHLEDPDFKEFHGVSKSPLSDISNALDQHFSDLDTNENYFRRSKIFVDSASIQLNKDLQVWGIGYDMFSCFPDNCNI